MAAFTGSSSMLPARAKRRTVEWSGRSSRLIAVRDLPSAKAFLHRRVPFLGAGDHAPRAAETVERPFGRVEGLRRVARRARLGGRSCRERGPDAAMVRADGPRPDSLEQCGHIALAARAWACRTIWADDCWTNSTTTPVK
ncbi:hypothetical protein AB0D10_42215 [Kitasatospora sp. NPDC048545]|uniref:hypothetical protein n=1 Tax=Kitasatospora sp. NPDC048545 TaxID=3157208 RepID=UPI0033ED35BC